jgi:hypothetical protein
MVPSPGEGSPPFGSNFQRGEAVFAIALTVPDGRHMPRFEIRTPSFAFRSRCARCNDSKTGGHAQIGQTCAGFTRSSLTRAGLAFAQARLAAEAPSLTCTALEKKR